MGIEILRKLGLDEKEIKVYLVLLKVGNVTASRISKESDIDRATCYRYLDSLINKGMVSYAIENGVKFFGAAHPDKILKDLKERTLEYKKILPGLVEMMVSPKEETGVELYKGKEGIKTVLREILRTKQDHLVLGDEGHAEEILPVFYEQFINECRRSRIRERVLCSVEVYDKIKKFEYKYSKTRSLSQDLVLPTTTLIFGDKIALFDWKAPNVVVISSKNLADTYRNYFGILWKIGK